MRKIVIAMDSFKGTLGAPEVCATIAAGFNKILPEVETVSLPPIADGGEGTVDCFWPLWAD